MNKLKRSIQKLRNETNWVRFFKSTNLAPCIRRCSDGSSGRAIQEVRGDLAGIDLAHVDAVLKLMQQPART